jgi:hypothetical protein
LNFANQVFPLGVHPIEAADANAVVFEVAKNLGKNVPLFSAGKVIIAKKQGYMSNDACPGPVIKGNPSFLRTGWSIPPAVFSYASKN